MSQYNINIDSHCILARKFPIELIRIIRSYATSPDKEIINQRKYNLYHFLIKHCTELQWHLEGQYPIQPPLAFGKEKYGTLNVLIKIIEYIHRWYSRDGNPEEVIHLLNHSERQIWSRMPDWDPGAESNPEIISLNDNFKWQIVSSPLRRKIVGPRYLTG